MKKRNKIIIWAIVLLGIVIFFLIGWGFYQEPRRAQEKQEERTKKIVEENPEAAEKLKLWKEGKIELSDEEVKKLVEIFDGEISD